MSDSNPIGFVQGGYWSTDRWRRHFGRALKGYRPESVARADACLRVALANRGIIRGGANAGEKLPQMSRVLKYPG